MVLVFSLQPNEINAGPAATLSTEQFAKYMNNNQNFCNFMWELSAKSLERRQKHDEVAKFFSDHFKRAFTVKAFALKVVDSNEVLTAKISVHGQTGYGTLEVKRPIQTVSAGKFAESMKTNDVVCQFMWALSANSLTEDEKRAKLATFISETFKQTFTVDSFALHVVDSEEVLTAKISVPLTTGSGYLIMKRPIQTPYVPVFGNRDISGASSVKPPSFFSVKDKKEAHVDHQPGGVNVSGFFGKAAAAQRTTTERLTEIKNTLKANDAFREEMFKFANDYASLSRYQKFDVIFATSVKDMIVKYIDNNDNTFNVKIPLEFDAANQISFDLVDGITRVSVGLVKTTQTTTSKAAVMTREYPLVPTSTAELPKTTQSPGFEGFRDFLPTQPTTTTLGEPKVSMNISELEENDECIKELWEFADTVWTSEHDNICYRPAEDEATKTSIEKIISRHLGIEFQLRFVWFGTKSPNEKYIKVSVYAEKINSDFCFYKPQQPADFGGFGNRGISGASSVKPPSFFSVKTQSPGFGGYRDFLSTQPTTTTTLGEPKVSMNISELEENDECIKELWEFADTVWTLDHDYICHHRLAEKEGIKTNIGKIISRHLGINFSLQFVWLGTNPEKKKFVRVSVYAEEKLSDIFWYKPQQPTTDEAAAVMNSDTPPPPSTPIADPPTTTTLGEHERLTEIENTLKANDEFKKRLWKYAETAWTSDNNIVNAGPLANDVRVEVRRIIRQFVELESCFKIGNVRFSRIGDEVHSTVEDTREYRICFDIYFKLRRVTLEFTRPHHTQTTTTTPLQTIASPTALYTITYLTTSNEVKDVLKVYSEFFWIYNGWHVGSELEQTCNEDGAIGRINDLLDCIKKTPPASDDGSSRPLPSPVVRKPLIFLESETNDDFATLKLYYGGEENDVKINLGNRQTNSEEIRKFLLNKYKDVAFHEREHRRETLRFAYFLSNNNDAAVDESDSAYWEKNPVAPFRLRSNEWFVENILVDALSVTKNNNSNIVQQQRIIGASFRNKEGGYLIGEMNIKAEGPDLKLGEFSDDDMWRLNDFQGRLTAAAVLEWTTDSSRAAVAEVAWTDARVAGVQSLGGSVKTEFDNEDTNCRFTVTTELEGINVESDDVIAYKLLSTVSDGRFSVDHTIRVKSKTSLHLQTVANFKKALAQKATESWSKQIKTLRQGLEHPKTVKRVIESCIPLVSTVPFEGENVEVTTRLRHATIKDYELRLTMESTSNCAFLRGTHFVYIPLWDDFKVDKCSSAQKKVLADFQKYIYINAGYQWSNAIYMLTRLNASASAQTYVKDSEALNTVFTTTTPDNDKVTATTTMTGATMVDNLLRFKVFSKFKSGTKQFEMNHYLTRRN
eukprot:GHVS01023390.1.p1 GENE.GHVS01023390.1~~GHVS01023390.1.p1  ORF type:complete len:1369 (+),score=165.02 GHVS01023390.1:31-4107(+)